MIKGVTRIENFKNRPNGWWARLQSRGVKYQKFFKDSDCGGNRAAKREAKAFYQQMLLEHPKMSRLEYAERDMGRNSEIIGVQRVVNLRFGHEYHAYKARWSPKKGVRCVRTFSIDLYGEAEALRRAVEARLQGLSEMSEK